MTSVLVVSPSVTVSHAERFCSAAEAATGHGGDVRAVLIANSTGTHTLAARWPGIVVLGSNAGFAASINEGAAVGRGFRWLVVANDDMEWDAETFRRLGRLLAEEPADELRMLKLVDEPWRRIPGVGGVFAILSLLERVTLPVRLDLGQAHAAANERFYPPFGMVAISAPLWRHIGGMEESIPFCFEDAWFVRQARRLPKRVHFGDRDIGLAHLHSLSTTANIDIVLPVIARSAVVYLGLSGVPGWLARLVCVGALLVRVPLSLAATANRARHLRGIWLSLVTVVSGRRVTLPHPADIHSEHPVARKPA